MISAGMFDIRSTNVYTPAMQSMPKQTRVEDPDYLDWIRTLPCSACGASNSVPHHHPAAGHSSVGLKTSDYRTLPLCFRDHDRVHRAGKLSFWGDLELVEVAILRLNESYFFGEKCIVYQNYGGMYGKSQQGHADRESW